MKAIRIYVEGGGNSRDGRRAIRQGFQDFLREVLAIARRRRIDWDVIPRGGRDQAYRHFEHAPVDHPGALCILLVDSEGPVTSAPRAHLRARDKWACPDHDDQYHLMVQAMEAWLVADLQALQDYYGPAFNPNPIPRHDDVEAISKDDLEPALKQASGKTSKGEYHKLHHAPDILARLDPAKVRRRARHCDRLFSFLEAKLAEG